MEKLVSIIIPVYNVERFLEKNIISLATQTYKNLELIYVNNESTDNSLEILNKYAKKYDNMIVINKKHGPVTTSRNLGLENARGEYIGFCDADDYVSKYYVQILVETLEKNNADVSVCEFMKVREDVKNFNFKLNSNKKDLVLNNVQAINKLVNKNFYVWNKLYKREVVENIKFDETIHYAEDAHYNYFAIKNTKRVAFNKNKLYAYVQRNGSLVNSKFNKNKLSGLKGIKEIVEDSSNNFNEVVKTTRAWLYIFSYEMLYCMSKDKSFEETAIIDILNDLKNNREQFKKCKKLSKFKRMSYLIGERKLRRKVNNK